mgnify:CR=1 FL=1
MGTRGVYRGVYSSLPDDPDFQALPAHARLLFYTLRCCVQAGPAAIFRYYHALLMIQTGVTAKQLEAAFVALEAPQPSGGDPWIYREGVLVWVRNGLRHDPHLTLANPKHRKSVEMAIQALPKQPIVATYCKYYGLAYPYATQAVPSEGLSLEKKRKEEEKNTPIVPSSGDDFERFWVLYPKKIGKGKARQEWVTAQKKRSRWPGVGKVLEAVQAAQRSAAWTKDGGQFIPHPATWLHQERWLDEPAPNPEEHPYGHFVDFPSR